MHWAAEKKLFGKSLNLENLATRFFFATEQVWNNTKLEYLATRNVFFAFEQVSNNLECLATRNVFC